jgi:hypothetical protein
LPTTACPNADCNFITADVPDAAERIALLTIHASTHAPAAITAAKTEKVNRPIIVRASTSEDWEYFVRRWRDYKTATHITGNDTKIQLMECCEETLRSDLHRSDKEISSKDETTILTAIRRLAVREENTMVSRVILQSMHQDRNEGVRNFSAKLSGQADICKFVAKCECGRDVNFTDQIVCDTLIRGLDDPDIRQDIMGHENQDLNLEAVLKLVEAKEFGKRSEASLAGTEGAHAFSNYKTIRAGVPGNSRSTQNVNGRCTYCGEPNHDGGNTTRFRRTQCKAFGETCKNCGVPNHFSKVCTQRKNSKKPVKEEKSRTRDEAGLVYDMLCKVDVVHTVSSKESYNTKAIILNHHIFSHQFGWERRSSRPQPCINITARVNKDDYTHFGQRPPKSHRTATLTAIADTGCQSSLLGIKLVHNLGIKKSELIPVHLQMKAINHESVHIIGAVLLRISGQDSHGHHLETAQVCYVTPETDKFFLSREACVGLGLISDQFPHIGEIAEATKAASNAVHDEYTEDCTCPKRTLPPLFIKGNTYQPTISCYRRTQRKS